MRIRLIRQEGASLSTRFVTLAIGQKSQKRRPGGAAWTGDSKASWEVLASTPTTLLNWNLSGFCPLAPVTSAASSQRLHRNYCPPAGCKRALFPMRSHFEIGVKPHFPWLFGADAFDAMRKAIDRRYQLISYSSSLVHETFQIGYSARSGIPQRSRGCEHVR